MAMTARARHMLALVAVTLTAAALRFYRIDWGLPEVYEEATPFNNAWEMWGGRPDLDLNPHFFNYPSLTMYLQLAGQWLLYVGMRLTGAIGSALDYQAQFFVDKTPLVLVGRSIHALFGTATVAVLFALGRRVIGLWGGLLAATALAVCAFHIERSQMIEVDVPLTAFVVAALYYCVRLLDDAKMKWYVLAGVSCGLAASCKYTGAMLVLPIVVAHVLAQGGARRNWRGPLIAVGVAALAFALTSPFVFLDAATFWQHLSYERTHMAMGHFGLEGGNRFLYYAGAFGRILGWPLAVAGVIGFVVTTIYHRERWAIVVASFAVLYCLMLMTWEMRADRYIVAVLPVMVLFAAAAAVELVRAAATTPRRGKASTRTAAHEGTRAFKLGDRARTAVALAMAVVLILPLFVKYPAHLRLRGADTRGDAKEWIEANVPSGAFIAMESYGPPLYGPHWLAVMTTELRNRVIALNKDRPQYAVQPIPLLQVAPERVEAFYDLDLYEMADLIVTTSGVRSRYLRDPVKFRRQVRFYEELETTFERIRVFEPTNKTGPVITIYRNPRYRVPFGVREPAPVPELRPQGTKMSGVEELFFNNLGVNYEVFGHTAQALECYIRAYDYPRVRPAIHRQAAFGVVRCLTNLGKPAEALEFIEWAARTTPNAEEAASLRALADVVRSRAGQ